ncbi:MAG: hypothetical protein IKR08_02195 [Firmicutes bacterium]|nr:hypothetical protein [Bacillota bacterium]
MERFEGGNVMDDKKIAELEDEVLDDVAGGASYKYDMITKRWFVYRGDGRLYAHFSSENEAKSVAWHLSNREDAESIVPPDIIDIPG